MRYNILLKVLRALIHMKRFFWWAGDRAFFVLAGLILFFWHPVAKLNYKITYFFKKMGLGKTNNWFLKRDYLQVFVFVALFIVALPQTKVYGKIYSQNVEFLPGQNTIVYSLSGPEEEYSIEIINANTQNMEAQAPTWKDRGVLAPGPEAGQSADNLKERDLSAVVAGGSAISKPNIISGAVTAGKRDRATEYIVGPGDSLSSIAYKFNISISTILWENKLTSRSIIRIGDKLIIPPVTGVMHVVKKGDTISKIAKLYKATNDSIIKFNKLKEDGSDLVVGEKIMVPDGTKQIVVTTPATVSGGRIDYGSAPPASKQSPGTSGFVWPSGARYITQYYSWIHHAVDIAGPYKTPIYAAKSGTVEISQCGWNSGYGCYIVINHGDGTKTLYGHHSVLLVSPGDYIRTGQTIGLMGNTGKVRGVTGIHLHFELIVNGVRVNPLGYIK